MTVISNSFRGWLEHTRQYYAVIISVKRVRTSLLILVIVCLCSAFVVTHAAGGTVANWLLKDALNTQMLSESNFAFTTLAEAPTPSANRFHLQIPMTLEEYVDENIYSVIPDALALTLEDGFYDKAYEPLPAGEWDAGGDDATEFIFNRPPDPPIG